MIGDSNIPDFGGLSSSTNKGMAQIKLESKRVYQAWKGNNVSLSLSSIFSYFVMQCIPSQFACTLKYPIASPRAVSRLCVE